jgi:hypothetical protein
MGAAGWDWEDGKTSSEVSKLSASSLLHLALPLLLLRLDGDLLLGRWILDLSRGGFLLLPLLGWPDNRGLLFLLIVV